MKDSIQHIFSLLLYVLLTIFVIITMGLFIPSIISLLMVFATDYTFTQCMCQPGFIIGSVICIVISTVLVIKSIEDK